MPGKTLTEIRSIARGHTRTAIRTLVGIMRSENATHCALISSTCGRCREMRATNGRCQMLVPERQAPPGLFYWGSAYGSFAAGEGRSPQVTGLKRLAALVGRPKSNVKSIVCIKKHGETPRHVKNAAA